LILFAARATDSRYPRRGMFNGRDRNMQRLDYYQIAPEPITKLASASQYLDTASVDSSLRLLIEIRVSQINGCAYCVDLHSRQARKRGEVEQRLDTLFVWRETPFFSDRERAALAWAESVTLVSETRVPDAVFESLQEHFTDREIVDLTMIVSLMNAWNRIAISFRKTIEDTRT